MAYTKEEIEAAMKHSRDDNNNFYNDTPEIIGTKHTSFLSGIDYQKQQSYLWEILQELRKMNKTLSEIKDNTGHNLQ